MATAAAAHRVGVHNLHAGILRRAMKTGKTGSIVAFSAYINRDKFEAERTGETHDFSRINNPVLSEGFYVPHTTKEWAQDREQFWNEVERRENRTDSQLARTFIATLPHEMDPQHAEWALKDWGKEQFTRKGYAWEFAIHPAHEGGDERNLHAHINVALRKIDKNGDWAKAKDPAEENIEQLNTWKKSLAHHLNRQLERHDYDIRVTHLSLEDRGEQREPEIKMGPAATALERDGIETDKGNVNRAIRERNAEREREAELRAKVREGIHNLDDKTREEMAFEPAEIEERRRAEQEQRDATERERQAHRIEFAINHGMRPPAFDPAFAREEITPNPQQQRQGPEPQDREAGVVPETTREGTQRSSYEADNAPSPPPSFHRAAAREITREDLAAARRDAQRIQEEIRQAQPDAKFNETKPPSVAREFAREVISPGKAERSTGRTGTAKKGGGFASQAAKGFERVADAIGNIVSGLADSFASIFDTPAAPPPVNRPTAREATRPPRIDEQDVVRDRAADADDTTSRPAAPITPPKTVTDQMIDALRKKEAERTPADELRDKLERDRQRERELDM